MAWLAVAVLTTVLASSAGNRWATNFSLPGTESQHALDLLGREWVRRGDASAAVADGITFTGQVITAAAAIMICVFLSFMLGNQRTIKEFGFGLGFAVFLDALVVRCVVLPAVLGLLGAITWRLPRRLDARLPHFNIEGSAVRAADVRSRWSTATGQLAGAYDSPADQRVGSAYLGECGCRRTPSAVADLAATWSVAA